MKRSLLLLLSINPINITQMRFLVNISSSSSYYSTKLSLQQNSSIII
uniref:Uncharacterized protein n=1 Tax=Palisada sp. TaxID=1955416 RepID=A0A1Z1MSD8_9FLOR|nr:hypothetical protein [Palisada sp.]